MCVRTRVCVYECVVCFLMLISHCVHLGETFSVCLNN